jgi:hypothetical protein
MSVAHRRERIARIRSLEHRAATARTAIAQAAVVNLTRVSTRIAALQSGLSATVGEANGQSLKARSEMAARLNAAQTGLLHPLQQALTVVEGRAAEQRAAHQREDSAAKLHVQAVKTAEKEATLSADANRPFRKLHIHLGDAP